MKYNTFQQIELLFVHYNILLKCLVFFCNGLFFVDFLYCSSLIHRHWSNLDGISPSNPDVDGLVQDCSISNALAMEILNSCNEPSTYNLCIRVTGASL